MSNLFKKSILAVLIYTWASLAIAQTKASLNSYEPYTAESEYQEPSMVFDPLESINRPIYRMNKTLDKHIAKPVARAYVNWVPSAMRTGLDNFLTYVKTPYYIVNYALQGNGDAFANQMNRFILNTFTLGFIDIAQEASFGRDSTSIGDTLGVYGVPSGPFLMLPLLGPSSLRDVASPVGESVSTSAVTGPTLTMSVTLTGAINTRASLLGADDVLEGAALDEYAFLKNAWSQQRASKIEALKDR